MLNEYKKDLENLENIFTFLSNLENIKDKDLKARVVEAYLRENWRVLPHENAICNVQRALDSLTKLVYQVTKKNALNEIEHYIKDAKGKILNLNRSIIYVEDIILADNHCFLQGPCAKVWDRGISFTSPNKIEINIFQLSELNKYLASEQDVAFFKALSNIKTTMKPVSVGEYVKFKIKGKQKTGHVIKLHNSEAEVVLNFNGKTKPIMVPYAELESVIFRNEFI